MKKLLYLILLSSGAFAQTLPTPLSLNDVLSWADNESFAQKQQQLELQVQTLELSNTQDGYNTKASLDLALGSRAEYDQGLNNSHGFIRLSKVLYDQSLEISGHAQRMQLDNTKMHNQQIQHDRDIALMRGFFDVVLADMGFETVLERLANAAVKQNRVQEDYDLQAASEVELLERQTQTQALVVDRIQAESKQISTRAKLAQLLNLDYEQRPDDVLRPDLKYLFKQELPGFEIFQTKLVTHNPKLKQLQHSLSGIQQQISQENDNLGLVLSSNARLGEQAYQRDKNGQWRLGINLSMPLGGDDKKRQKIAKLKLKSQQQTLAIEQHQQSLLSQALDYHQTLRALRQVHKALMVELDYRDLFLERARANYEMGLKSGIGNAMTNYTDTEHKLAQNEFDYLLTLKQLYFLVGENYEI